MISSAREMHILKRLNEAGVVDYKSIASEIGVSEATIRRDFEKLEQNGKLRRVYGGAVLNEENRESFDAELSVHAKSNLNREEKQRVALAAIQTVRPGECIYLDDGSSILPLARELFRMRVRIVTSNYMVLRYATSDSPAELFLLGGRYYPADGMTTGPISETVLEDFRFHRAFIGCMGLDLQKDIVYATDLECMRLKQCAMRNAADSYLLADQSKLKKTGLFRVAGIQDFTRVYLDGPKLKGELPENIVFTE